MKARHIVLTVVAILVVASPARADFNLVGTQHLDVNTTHLNGVLYDASTADVLAGGYIQDAYVNEV